MRIQEKALTTLLVLSLMMNVFLLIIVIVPGVDYPQVRSHPSGEDKHLESPHNPPSPSRVIESAGAASMQAPVVLQKFEADRGGPFAAGRVIEEGAMVDVSVEVVPGRGRVLVHTTPLMGMVFQDAANHAVVAAQNHSNVNLSESDIIFGIHGPESVLAIDGPSAGALMAMLLISVLEEFEIDENMTMTGTIDEDGGVGPVGGILMKAEAAAASGKTLLLLSEKNNQVLECRKETKTLGGLHVMRQRPIIVDTKEYIEKNYGICVEYVSSIDTLLTASHSPDLLPITALV